MLKKLIKYDLLADYKKYAVLYVSMLATSVLMLFFDKMTSWVNNNTFMEVMAAIFAVLFFALAVISGVMLLVFSTVRFYKNIVRDEGYLMHTLPVPTWQLIASKLISVYIWFLTTLIVTGICSGIAFGEPFWLFKIIDRNILSESFREGFMVGFNNASGSEMAITDSDMHLFAEMLGSYAVLILLSPFMAMAHIYFSFALGNLFNKSKLGMSVLLYFAIQFAESILGGMCSMFITPSFVAEAAKYEEEIPAAVILEFFNSIMGVTLVTSAVLSVGFLIGAERIFAKKLNLE
ncbi:MAG: hypothetical protein NC253_15560 [Ruminococcus sp.]|nr:hypothetical protein [Ruminococcus sp.]MCM1382826.1 hypothetical protein [Muribaculaceae bacterium]MCM1480646.1 hypothetical protein [Muribaculaceae bacterium]